MKKELSERQQGLLSVFPSMALGQTIGFLLDYGMSGEEILELCKTLVSNIQKLVGDKDSLETFEKFSAAVERIPTKRQNT